MASAFAEGGCGSLNLINVAAGGKSTGVGEDAGHLAHSSSIRVGQMRDACQLRANEGLMGRALVGHHGRRIVVTLRGSRCAAKYDQLNLPTLEAAVTAMVFGNLRTRLGGQRVECGGPSGCVMPSGPVQRSR